MSRVLVTGAAGFIGRHTLGPLVATGHDVHAISRGAAPADAPDAVTWHRADLLDDPASAVARIAPDRLLHLAWCTEHGRYWTSLDNLRWVEATLALVRAFAGAGGRRAVLAGTCAEYDWAGSGPRAEGRTPLRPATLYGVAKHATHMLVEAAAGELGIDVAWGRIFFLYGPGEDERRLVASVAGALARGERAATSAGTQRRDFLHVADVGGAFAALVDAELRGAVNIASGEGRSLRSVIEQIGRAAGREGLLDIGALPGRPGDPEELVAEVTRLREEVGFQPRVPLADGLAETAAWWRERALA
ncbi:MAG TPA: NAD(P)-dependent oxidoreductase [Thermoleophilaceae bacterium]